MVGQDVRKVGARPTVSTCKLPIHTFVCPATIVQAVSHRAYTLRLFSLVCNCHPRAAFHTSEVACGVPQAIATFHPADAVWEVRVIAVDAAIYCHRTSELAGRNSPVRDESLASTVFVRHPVVVVQLISAPHTEGRERRWRHMRGRRMWRVNRWGSRRQRGVVG